MLSNDLSLLFRLKNEAIVKEIRRKVQSQPTAVCHIPQALKYLVTTETLLSDAHEVSDVKRYSVQSGNFAVFHLKNYSRTAWSTKIKLPLRVNSKSLSGGTLFLV